MINNYSKIKAYQESYRTIAISDKSLKREINAMLPMFLLVDSKNSTLDHFLFNESIITYFRESNGLLCPLCDSHLKNYDKDMHCFKCLSCDTLFYSFDDNVNSIITSYLYNTIKSTECQEKNQIFQENLQEINEVSNNDLKNMNLQTFKDYQEFYAQDSINDKKVLDAIQKTLPKYLHVDKRSKKLDHLYYDTTIVEHLQKAHKGAFVCPICNSGLRENKSGALNFDDAAQYFHCFACGITLFPINSQLRDTINSLLGKINFNSDKEAKKEEFQENIEDFYKQLLLQHNELTLQERKEIIEKTFANRGYSSELIDYVLHCKDIVIANDDTYNYYKRLYVSIYDTNLQDKIGFQKLAYSDEKGLAKFYVKGSNLGFTLFGNPNYPNCCFIVESVTNALAIYNSGFNSLCCYTKGSEQPYKAYAFALQNGLQPILFLDRDVRSIDSKYISINWIVNIEPFFSPLQLKSNADASDLLVLDRLFLTDLLKNAYNTYYKKECYSQATLEEAFQSDAKFTVIQAQVGNGKTTLAITKYKDALNPLYSVFTKDATEEVADKLEEELKIEANIVNSDSHIITEDKHGIITTHERLSKTTQLEDYAIYGETPIDVAFIDEMHKFLQEHNDTIAQPYYTTNAKEDVKDYIIINNNETMSKYVKEGLSVEVIAYKQNDDKQAVNPIEMPKKVSTTDARKLQTIYLDKSYSVRELVDPKNYDTLIEGTTNIFAKKIDEKLAFWIADYAINANLKEMLSYDYDKIKEELKAKYPKLFNSIRNISLPLSLAFFRNCYLVCAFPIRKHDKKPLSFEEWKQDIQRNIEMETNNNHSIYYKIELRYVNLQPLVNILKKAKRVFLFGASDFAYKDSFIEEFKECFGNDFRYYNLSPLGKKELETSLLKVKKIEDKDIYQVLKGVSSLDCNAVLVTPKLERAKEIYKLLKRHKLNNFTFFTKDCFTSFFSDSVDFETVDNKAKTKPYKNIVVYANAPILESSNKLEDYTLMLIDCNIFKPKIEYANPYLQELGVTITEQLKTKLIQTIGRLYRQKGHKIVIVLLNHTSVEFDIVSFLKEKSEVVNVYEDSQNFTYYKDPKCFIENIQRALQGEEMTKYKVIREKKKTEKRQEQKEQKQEQKQAKIVDMAIKEASEREIQRATNDYKEYTEQETLAYNKLMLFEAHKPQGITPFNDNILQSPYITYDTEVFPNKFIICYHDFLKNGYNKVIDKDNLDYEWLKHFFRLPLIGFNNANYDNPILLKALNLLHPNCQYVFENYDFNKLLKEFSNSIIEEKEKDKKFYQFRKRAYAIGIGDSMEMVTKNIPGKSKDSLKCFMLDLGLSVKETPYPFDTVLTEEQTKEEVAYCMNDSLTVALLIDKYKGHFQTSKQLAEQAGLNGNYPKISLLSEIIYNKELTKKERMQYNLLTLKVITDRYPNFKFNIGIEGKERYVNEYEDCKYLLGEGGFNLLPDNVLKKDANGNWQPIESNNGLYLDVTSLDIDSMHPNSSIQVKYFGKYTKNYQDILDLKELCSSKKGFDYIKEELAKKGHIVNNEEELKEKRGLFKLILNSTYGNTYIKDKKTNKVKESTLNKCEHNIIALNGSCYSSTLHHELVKEFPDIVIVQMKTDSIKIANCTQKHIDFCNKLAKGYGFTYKVEDTFQYIACKGNEYIAINSKGEIVKSSSDDEQEDYAIDIKGSSFKILYDDRGVLRTKNDLRSLLITIKGKSVYKLGTKQEIGKKTILNYVKDVQSQKVQYFLPVIDACKEGLYPYYENKNGSKCAVSGFKNQKVIAIYDLKELETIDKSMIDYDFFQNNVLNVLDVVLDIFLAKREPELINKFKKQNYSNRINMKLPKLNSNELYFFNVLKNKLAFV